MAPSAPASSAPTPAIIDRYLLRARRRRALALGPATFLLDRVAEDLVDRLATVLRSFACALDLGTPTDAVRRALAASGKVGTIIAANALVTTRAPMPGPARPASRSRPTRRPCRCATGALDLVVSGLALHFVNDLPGTLVQIRRALRPDGLLVAALLGGDTLTELRAAFAAAEAEIEDGISPRVLPFADLRELGALLQRAGFALPVTDVDRLTVRYASPLALMHDLRRMGADQSARRPQPAAAAARHARPHAGDLRANVSPIRTGASAPPSRSSICRAGPRTRASSSRSPPARPAPASPTRSARRNARRARRRDADGRCGGVGVPRSVTGTTLNQRCITACCTASGESPKCNSSSEPNDIC